MQEATTGMREKGINNMDRIMYRQRRMEKENKTLGTERCEKTDALVHKNINTVFKLNY